jgi:hypothetical protein
VSRLAKILSQIVKALKGLFKKQPKPPGSVDDTVGGSV